MYISSTLSAIFDWRSVRLRAARIHYKARNRQGTSKNLPIFPWDLIFIEFNKIGIDKHSRSTHVIYVSFAYSYFETG